MVNFLCIEAGDETIRTTFCLRYSLLMTYLIIGQKKSLQLQEIINNKETDSKHSVQSSLKYHPLWVTKKISFQVDRYDN